MHLDQHVVRAGRRARGPRAPRGARDRWCRRPGRRAWTPRLPSSPADPSAQAEPSVRPTYRPQTVPRDRDRGRRRGPGAGAVHDRRRVGDGGEHPRAGLPEPPPAPPAAPAAGAEAPGLRPRPPAHAGRRPRLAARRLGAATESARPGHPLRAARRPAAIPTRRSPRPTSRSCAGWPPSRPPRGCGRRSTSTATAEALPGLVGDRARAAVGARRRHPARRHRPPPGGARRASGLAATMPELHRSLSLRGRPAPRRPRRARGVR